MLIVQFGFAGRLDGGGFVPFTPGSGIVFVEALLCLKFFPPLSLSLPYFSTIPQLIMSLWFRVAVLGCFIVSWMGVK